MTAVIAAWSLMTAASAHAGARVPARLLAADGSRVRFQVDVASPSFTPSPAIPGTEIIRIEGFSLEGNPGEPALPARRFLVALPPDGDYTLTSRVISAQPLGERRLQPVAHPRGLRDDELGWLLGEEYVWDEKVYRAWAQRPPAEAGEVGFIRNQRVLAVRVNPVFYDPTTLELSVATAVEVEVTITNRSRPTTAAPPRAESPRWNETFGRLFVNAQQTGDFRATARVPIAPSQLARAIPGTVKMKVRETGIHRVTASALVASGFPAGQPVGGLRVFKRGYNEAGLAATTQDIAFRVREEAGGVTGTFDGNDLLIFYGRRLRDDVAQGDVREQYSFFNTYWLEPSVGVTIAERTPGVGFVTADTVSASFPATGHFETDAWFFDGIPNGTNDLYYVNWGFEPGPVDQPMLLGAVRPGTNVALSAELLGRDYVSPRTIRVSLDNSQGETVLNGAFSVPLKARRTFTAAVPAANFDVGTNRFRINRPDASRSTLQVLLNWVEVSYSSLYRARGNALRFNSATLAGDTSITVTGLSTASNLELFDITNPVAPVHLNLSAEHFQPVTGGLALSFRETIPSRREFQLVPVTGMIAIAPADLESDQPSSIIGSTAESGVDVLVVSHGDYLSRMRDWASYRRAQGYRVYLADVAEVYDEFNGGVPSPVAVYRFARHFFERGNASALVLVGDASEDHKLVHDDSGPNFVPTFTRIDVVPSLSLDEVVTTDKRFVKFPGPTGVTDAFPDMILGRIPVGNVGELDIVLDKTYAYEKPAASDFWRKRMIIVADDTYSQGGSSSFGSFPYCDNLEVGFEISQENCAQIIERALPAGYDVVRFFLDDITAPFHTAQCLNYFAGIRYTRQNATEVLLNELNQGATMVTIQSHMNRSLISHERLLSTYDGAVLDGPGRDHLRVENRNKPWIVFGMGCHFSEFAPARERESQTVGDNAPNGDAFAEQFLLQRERGAVGTYGSTGFEYLFPNAAYMETTTRVWFYEAPYDTMVNQTRGEWVFGELMFLSEAQLAGGQRDPVERYQILSDPLLRIDAGPPSFDVTVDGASFQSGSVVEAGGEGDTIHVVAIVTDENAIRAFKLEIDGVDLSDSLRVEPLVDQSLPRARQYRVSFAHKVRPDNYDVILRAYQAPDTLAGTYHMVAEFVLRVESRITVSINGRTVQSGAAVPAEGRYRIDLTFPVQIEYGEIAVFIDDAPVLDASIFHPSPTDSLAWSITFRKTLSPGSHVLRVAAGTIEFIYRLVVEDDPGLRDVVNYPNPFRSAGTRFVYSNSVEIIDGTIEVYTVSGRFVRRLAIPSGSRFPGQNAVFWDGRDTSGGTLANGTYLYVIRVNQRGGSATVRGRVTKLE